MIKRCIVMHNANRFFKFYTFEAPSNAVNENGVFKLFQLVRLTAPIGFA